jgi:hypothetical protein
MTKQTKCKIDPAWKRRLQKANKEYPLLQPLRKKLLKIGGAEIAPQPEPQLKKIMKRGEIIDLPVKMQRMRSSNCHQNTSELYHDKRIDAIATGWVLNDDCVWRQHTWGLKDDHIIETTEKRKKYFGVILNDKEGMRFMRNNL